MNKRELKDAYEAAAIAYQAAEASFDEATKAWIAAAEAYSVATGYTAEGRKIDIAPSDDATP